MIPSARVALGVAALGLLAGGSHAAGLFLPVDQAGAAVDGAPAAGSPFAPRATALVPDMWGRQVRIARHELVAAHESVVNAGAGHLLLNVSASVRLNVVVERTAPTKWGYSLSGRVAGRGWGFVTLVVHKEAVAGTIWTPDVAYELSYLGSGVHSLRDVTSTPPPECGGALPAAVADAPAPQSGPDDGSVVDILVVWTPAAEALYGGGEPQVLSRIDMLVASTNDAFERSGAFVSLRLVGAEKVDYAEANSGDRLADLGTDLGRLRTTDDGHMDGVHDQRDVLGADLVYLLVSRGGGLAGSQFMVGGGRGRTFAHEVGHNFGLGHERYEQRYTRLRPYGHGFTTRRCRNTIMSYGDGCRSRRNYPFYASPWRYIPVDGSALGVTRFSHVRGVRGPADAVLTLNRNRHGVANLRPSRSGIER